MSHAPRSAARRTTADTRVSASCHLSRGTGVTITRSAVSANDRSSSTVIENPRLLGTSPGSAATMRKSNPRMPSPERSRPKASHASPNSNGAKPGWTTVATVRIMMTRLSAAHPGWHESYDVCSFRHSWRELFDHSFSDMIILLFMSAIAVWGVVSALRAVRTDGFRRVPTDYRRLP